MKKFLALLICFTMLITLLSCVKVETDTKDKENEKTEEKREKRENEEENNDNNDKKESVEKDNDEIDDSEPPAVTESEEDVSEFPTPELLEGRWTGEIDIDYMLYQTMGMSFEDFVFGTSESEEIDISGFEYDEDCYMLIHLDFSGEENLEIAADTDNLKDFLVDYMNALFDYMASPEFMAVNSGITVEEFEALLAEEGMTTEDYSLMMKASMLEETGDLEEAVDEMFAGSAEDDLKSSGTYTIDGYEIIPKFEDDDGDTEESSTVFTYENGSIVMSATEENEEGEETTITVFFEKGAA